MSLWRELLQRGVEACLRTHTPFQVGELRLTPVWVPQWDLEIEEEDQ